MISYHNQYHLGDCIFHLAYMIRLANRHPGIEQTLYCDEKYHRELKHLRGQQGRIFFKPIQDKPSNSIGTWIGEDSFYLKHHSPEHYPLIIHDFYEKYVTPQVKLPSPHTCFQDVMWEIDPLPWGDLFDILYINAPPLSGQFEYQGGQFEWLCIEFVKRGYRVVTTHPSGNPAIPSTITCGMSLAQLAYLAPQCKYIMGVHTSPMVVSLNTESVRTVQKVWALNKYHNFDYGGGKFIHCRNFPDFVESLFEERIL